MQLRMWTYDLAREQSPTLDHLRKFADVTRAGGFNALGLYLEHRFAYPSLPWAHGKGALTPEMVTTLIAEYPDLQIIPFINLLGHMEGLIYTEHGVGLAEERFKGLQANPTSDDLVRLAETIIDDTLAIFPSSIIHIGGDETAQLGAGKGSRERVETFEETVGGDGKAQLYGDHFGPLAQRVINAGRRPAVWGDMFVDHPSALDLIPVETLIFDWQYFKSPHETAQLFTKRGFEVVYCPALHTYNASWLHLAQSEQNVRDHAIAAREDGVFGVCVTTWELALFGNYETLLPAIRASGGLLQDPFADHSAFLRAYEEESTDHRTFADLVGIKLEELGGFFAFSQIRSSMKCRLLLYSNPFLFWLRNREEILSDTGAKALKLLEHAIAIAPNASYRGSAEFIRLGMEFVKFAEESHQHYAAGRPGEAATALIPCRQIFENLAKIAKGNVINIGGSQADVERCLAARDHVEKVMRRVKEYGDGSLGYLPSFETLSHPKFIPHDQGNWWLVNRWANE